VLRRWKLAPEARAEELIRLFDHLPPARGTATPELERECRHLLGYHLASVVPDRWPAVASPFLKLASGSEAWTGLLQGLAEERVSLPFYEEIMSDVVPLLEREPATAPQGKRLRELVDAMAMQVSGERRVPGS
jgi:hypothetical protein